MVKGIRALERRFNAIPERIWNAAMPAMEKYAARIVADMKNLVPVRHGALRDSIGWTWGEDIPKGSLKIGTVRNRDYGKISITIYAGSKVAFYARFVEFGTAPHSLAKNASVERGLRQDQGGYHGGANASPFFYPAWRANRRAAKGAMTRAIRRAIKES